MIIRSFCEKDISAYRNICLATANVKNPSENRKKWILKLYCDYYTECEPQNCFTLADDNDTAVGYILCSENFDRYIKNFKLYFSEIKQLGAFYFFATAAEITSHRIIKKQSKAHMHIDILPEYQGNGGGTLLISKLKEHLLSKGINSITLTVGADNKGAIRFYKKNGFYPAVKTPFVYIMVCDL